MHWAPPPGYEPGASQTQVDRAGRGLAADGAAAAPAPPPPLLALAGTEPLAEGGTEGGLSATALSALVHFVQEAPETGCLHKLAREIGFNEVGGLWAVGYGLWPSIGRSAQMLSLLFHTYLSPSSPPPPPPL